MKYANQTRLCLAVYSFAADVPVYYMLIEIVSNRQRFKILEGRELYNIIS